MRSRSIGAMIAAGVLALMASEASVQDRQTFGAAMDAFARKAMQRVEAAPGVAPFRGEGMVFKLDADGRPTSLTYQDAVFERR